jgi:hypothetical protein
MDLNPQPLPPGIVIALNSGSGHPDLNPQPLPPGIVVAKRALNPQPLPPGKMAPQDMNPQPLPPGFIVRSVSPDSLSHTVAPFVTGTDALPRTFPPDSI